MLREFVLLLFLIGACTVPADAQTVPTPSGDPALTVQGAVEVAVSGNPEVLRAREQAREFQLRVRAVRADALPQIDVVGAFQRSRDPGLLNSPFFSRFGGGDGGAGGGGLPASALDPFFYGTYFYQVEVEQPVYEFGRVGAALEAARFEQLGVQADVEGVENRIALAVVRAYYDYLLAQARLDVLEAERRTRERQVQQVTDRLELGEATRLEQLQAQVALANLGPEVLTAQNAIRVALTRFNETLGRAPLNPFSPVERLDAPAAGPALPDAETLMELAEAHRPELRRYELSRSVLEAAEDVTRADLLPDISARLSLGINTFRLPNLSKPDLHNWTVGLNVNWTLFDGHRTSSTIAQYRSQRRQSELDEAAFRSRLASDLERASGDWRQALETIEASTLAVEQAREAQRVAEELFSLGAATFLDVLDAERALREAEFGRLQAYHAAASALAEVKSLVGLRADAPGTVLAAAPAPDPALPYMPGIGRLFGPADSHLSSLQLRTPGSLNQDVQK